MKILLTTIAALLVVGCGESQSPETPTAKAPDISIHEAAGRGNIEAVKKHLANGADVDTKDEFGSTPLHDAAYYGRYGRTVIIELLIAEGADVNVKNDKGNTPLDLAILDKQPETADLLRKHGGKTGKELRGR